MQLFQVALLLCSAFELIYKKNKNFEVKNENYSWST